VVNEHYVPQSYLRLFSPEGVGCISRYSLVEKHAGGDYYPPRDKYPITKAASSQEFADGWLEEGEFTDIESEVISSIKAVVASQPLDEDDIALISAFLSFQHGRTPDSKSHFTIRGVLDDLLGDENPVPSILTDTSWESALTHALNVGYKTLQHMGWFLVTNESDTPFITSDDPVTHYFSLNFEEVEDTGTQMDGREIYCPLSPDCLLILLDPCWYEVSGQFPETEVQQTTIKEQDDVHGINRLQALTAFQEVFGPVGYGGYLEEIVLELCEYFPHEDYVRGNKADIKTLELAQLLASYLPSAGPWYQNYGRPLIKAKQKKSHAVWQYSHNISFVNDLRRDQPETDYWDGVLDG
jgi:hypothetical protein